MKTRKISLDEAMSLRSAHVITTTRGAQGFAKAWKAPPSVDETGRSARFVMSTENVDRMGDVVVQKGLNIDEFLKNPIAPLFHNTRDFPIGMWEDVKKVSGSPRRTEGTLRFAEEGMDATADRAFKFVAAGMVRCVSIGFIAMELEGMWDDNDRFQGIKFLATEMTECSLVPVPANRDAFAKAAGGDPLVHASLIEEVLDTWARGPAGDLVPREDFEREYQIVKASGLPSFKRPPSLPFVKADADEDAGDLSEPVIIEIDTTEAMEKMSALTRMADGLKRSIYEAFGILPGAQKALLDAGMAARAAAAADEDDNSAENPPDAAPEGNGGVEDTEKTLETDEIREIPGNQPDTDAAAAEALKIRLAEAERQRVLMLADLA